MSNIILKINNEYCLFHYIRNILSDEELTKLKQWLSYKKFMRGEIFGKFIPREQLWYQEREKYFCENWKERHDRWQSNKYDDFLIELQNKIKCRIFDIISKIEDLNDETNIQYPNINSCLINKYLDGKDSIKPHRDTIYSFGENPTIINLSVGSKRNMIIKTNKDYEDIESKYEFELEDNSILIMAGGSQKYFTHQIPESKSEGIRYSLTFREYIYH